MSKEKRFTSESVTEGHPDKLCDQISDGILDALLASDPNSHVACETCATTGLILVMGEISTSCYVDIPAIVRRTVRDIGYDGAYSSFDYKTCSVLTAIDEQSQDIAIGVNSAFEHRNDGTDPLDVIGAGDQGMMFGYACNETPELMPAPISFAHAVSKKLAEVRKTGRLPFLLPDGKSQITVQYDDMGNPVRIETVVVSTQHTPDVELHVIKDAVYEEVVKKALPAKLFDRNTRFLVNPTGRFVIGGPQGDSGLTGRKIIVDTYGGYARHGGGAFSGKDPTKVDRSAAYMARYAAKNIVAAGLADRCELEVAYAIGVARPVSIFVDTFGTGKIPDKQIEEIVSKHFDFRPMGMINALNLRTPMYRPVAAYGHMGREDINVPWEKTDIADTLKAYLK